MWYTRQTQRFIEELRVKNFNPSWGFEVEPEMDTWAGEGGFQKGETFIFDIPALEGLAFDMESKQMLYFSCPTGYYKKYASPNTKIEYKYVLIPFSDIFSANVEVNSQTTVSTTTSKQNVVGRSIVGGLLAGDAGAIIGGTTGKEVSVTKSETVPKKIVFNIQTTYADYPIISFVFRKPYGEDDGKVGADKSMADIMYGTFSGEAELVRFYEHSQTRKCDTKRDLSYFRNMTYPSIGSKGDEDESIDEYSRKYANMGVILKRVNKYVMQIEAIIQQCNKELENDKVKSSGDVIAELTKLADLKEKGIITEEEFIKLKEKLI